MLYEVITTGGSSTTTTTETTTTTVPVTNTVYSEKFGMIELEVGLPVALNLGSMSFEADISYLV